MAAQSTSVIKLLQEKAVKEVNTAQEVFAAALKSSEEANNKHNMLLEYKQGYEDNLKKSLTSGLNIEAYQNYQNFLEKLDEALQGQKSILGMAEQVLQIRRKSLQEAQKKKLSYEVLLQRADKRALKSELKKDQKMMDEFAMRATRQK